MGQEISLEQPKKKKNKKMTRREEIQNVVKEFDISNSQPTISCKLFAFCGTGPLTKFNWREALLSDCKEMAHKFVWVSEIAAFISSCKLIKDEYFQSELPRVLYKANGKLSFIPLKC